MKKSTKVASVPRIQAEENFLQNPKLDPLSLPPSPYLCVLFDHYSLSGCAANGQAASVDKLTAKPASQSVISQSL